MELRLVHAVFSEEGCLAFTVHDYALHSLQSCFLHVSWWERRDFFDLDTAPLKNGCCFLHGSDGARSCSVPHWGLDEGNSDFCWGYVSGNLVVLEAKDICQQL